MVTHSSHTCPMASIVSGYWDLIGPFGQRVGKASWTVAICKTERYR